MFTNAKGEMFDEVYWPLDAEEDHLWLQLAVLENCDCWINDIAGCLAD